MAILIPDLLPTFEGIPSSAGQVATATCKLPPGRRYHRITLEIGNALSQSLNGGLTPGSAAMALDPKGNLVGEIRVKLGSAIQRTHTAFELDMMNALNGQTWNRRTTASLTTGLALNLLDIHFAEPYRKSIGQSQVGAWNVQRGQYDGLYIEVDLLSGANSVPVLTGTCLYEDTDGTEYADQGIGFITTVSRHNIGVTGTPLDINLKDKISEEGRLQVLQFFPTIEAAPRCVQYLKMTRNGKEIQDRISVAQMQQILLGYEMQPTYSWAATTPGGAAVPTGTCPVYHKVFDMRDDVRDGLPLANTNEFTVRAEFAATAAATSATSPAGAMIMLAQRLGLPVAR